MGIVQETVILPYEQMVHAQPGPRPGKGEAQMRDKRITQSRSDDQT